MDKLYLNIGDISENHYNYLMNLENVNGVGYGNKYINNKNTFEPCIHVLVEKKKDNRYLTKNNIIPKNYMGIKTDVIEVGKFTDSSNNSDSKDELFKDRPLQGGSRIGVLKQPGFGGMCCIVSRKRKVKIYNSKEYKYNYEYYVLSNSHVLVRYNKNPIGTPIVQPASIFERNIVALLEDFVPIKFYNKFNIFSYNTVDCAIARVLEKSLISNRAIGVGKIKGVAEAVENMQIKKIGAKTGINIGNVTTLNLTIRLDIDDGKRKLLFKKQILINVKTEGGDSGSPVLTKDNKLIGIHHSGNGKDMSLTSDINLVLKKLKVEVYTGE